MFDTTDAACRRRLDIPLDAWFPGDRSLPPRLKRICDHCPIRHQCLEWAIKHHELGIWGGTNAEQRQNLRTARLRKTCPLCSGKTPWTDDDAQVCTFCGTSWRRKSGVAVR